MLLGLVAGISAAVLFGTSAVLQAHAVRTMPASTDRLGGFVQAAVRNRWILLVVAAYLGGFLLHAVAIWLLPLYLAQAATAMSLPIAALATSRIEIRPGGRQWLAVGSVVAGVVLLAAAAGAPGAARVTIGFAGLLVAGVLLILLVSRWLRSAALLGTLAGVAFTGSAIGVRGVTWPVEPLVVAAAVCIPAYGLLGFWLYSSGLERAAVPVATAPMIVLQTAGPAVIGVALLGDGVRPGWWWAAAVGLLLATAGATLAGDAAAPTANRPPAAQPS